MLNIVENGMDMQLSKLIQILRLIYLKILKSHSVNLCHYGLAKAPVAPPVAPEPAETDTGAVAGQAPTEAPEDKAAILDDGYGPVGDQAIFGKKRVVFVSLECETDVVFTCFHHFCWPQKT